MGTRAAQIGADIAKLAPAAQRRRHAASPALRGAEIADWAPWGDHLRRGNDGIGIDPIVPVEVGDGTRLAEMLDTEWPDAVAVDRAKPCQGRRVAIQHGDNAAISGQTGKQPLDVRAGMHKPAFAGAVDWS